MRLGDLDNLKEVINDLFKTGEYDCNSVLKAIDSAPIVEAYPFEQVQELVKLNQQFAQEIENLKRSQSEWIPITFREADDDEYKEFLKRYDDIPREECKVYDCRMPDDGQEVLVTTCGGYVCEDIFCADPDAYGFENCSDPGDAIAWMPKPESYQKGGAV